MANTYYDGTGVLVLTQITSVITALFQAFHLNKEPVDDAGEIFIGNIAEDTDITWGAIAEGLSTLVAELSLPLGGATEPEEFLLLLAQHFGVDGDAEVERVINELEFTSDASLSDLFVLATRFDDGHQLQSIRFEGAWHSDKHRLGNFGGDGEYCGKHISVSTGSGSIINVGSEVDEALEAGDLDAAAARILEKLNSILDGVHDEPTRSLLRVKLIAGLASA